MVWLWKVLLDPSEDATAWSVICLAFAGELWELRRHCLCYCFDGHCLKSITSEEGVYAVRRVTTSL